MLVLGYLYVRDGGCTFFISFNNNEFLAFYCTCLLCTNNLSSNLNIVEVKNAVWKCYIVHSLEAC